MRNWALSKDFSLPYYSSSLLSPPRHPDLRPLPEGVGKRTLAGTRGAIRVIRYRDATAFSAGKALVCSTATWWRRAGFFFFQAEDGIRDYKVTGVQTCALPI